MVNKTDLLVVGAGAAGLLCAGYAGKRGLQVTVLEKMERPGRKLMITGKGRCNVTNNCSRDEFLAAVKQNGKFLFSASSVFSPQDTMQLLESLGVPLKTERGGRVFPVSDKSVDIVDALVSFAKANGAKIVQAQAKNLLIVDEKVVGVKTRQGEEIRARQVVLCTGGKSYPLTGSTGDGYELACQAGHTITSLRPSLIPIVTQENWCREVMGLSLKNVRLKLYQQSKNKPVFDELGEMLFTHFGISGPLVLSASAHMKKDINQYKLAIDLKPGLTIEQLDSRLLRDFEANSNKDFQNSLGALLPRALIPVIIRLSGITPDCKVHQVTKEQRRELGLLIKELPLTPKAFRPLEEAVITSGGVKVSEVNPGTMASKLVKGLYLAGELLDLDAYTGGYNLQIAFCTAYVAAMSVGKEDGVTSKR